MAAGLGFKDFVTGEVLTAADVDGYLMQGIWVFASAAARDAAVTSPQEGNFAFLKDTNTTTYYTGSAWANLDTTGMVNPMTTTGDTIYSSSGSTPARLGIGSTGDVLTVSGGLPVWSAPAGGGANWTLLNAGGTTLTGANTITVSGISGKDKIMVIIDDADSDTNDDISVRINTDTGNNYWSWGSIAKIGGTYGGNNYTGVNSLNAYGGPANAGNNRIYLGRTSGSVTSRVNGYVLITGCNSSGVKVYNSHGMGTYSEDVNQRGLWLGGYYNSASTVSSVSAIAGANFEGGKIYVYASA